MENIKLTIHKLVILCALILITMDIVPNAWANDKNPGFQRLNYTDSVQYEIFLNRDHPLIARAILKIPKKLRSDHTVLALRAQSLGTASQIKELRCNDSAPILETTIGEWEINTSCKIISWSISFDEAIDSNIDALLQRSFYQPQNGLWLLSESTSLLRLKQSISNPGAGINIFVASHGSRAKATLNVLTSTVSTINQAPDFYVFGNSPSLVNQFKQITVRHYVDNNSKFAELNLVPAYSDGLKYLLDVLNPDISKKAEIKKLNIVWLGRNASAGNINGAAGSNTLLINYMMNSQETRELVIGRSLLVALHETFHTLSNSNLETWASEGLAQYYAIKTLGLLFPKNQEVENGIRDHFLRPEISKKVLLELYREYQENKDYSVYPLFYTQGATFWYEIDSFIQKATNKKSNLDDYLSTILRETKKSNDLLQVMRKTLRDIDPDSFDSIVYNYVSRLRESAASRIPDREGATTRYMQAGLSPIW